MVSTLVGALWCRKRCDAAELAGDIAYFPPSPTSYALSEGTDGALVCALNPFYSHSAHALGLARAARAQVVRLRSGSGADIPAFLFAHARASLTLLFSHSNAVDCGLLLPFLDELSNRLRVHVFAYEYSGFGPGAASARPRSHAQRHDVQAAYAFLCARGLDPARQLVAYGQSIGCYPTLVLAARHRLLGVVAHSPMAGGLQLLAQEGGCCAPHRALGCLEPYPNLRLARMCAQPAHAAPSPPPAAPAHARSRPLTRPCARAPARRLRDPLLVIHGTADEIVPARHGQSVLSACPPHLACEPYWAQGAGHDNVLEHDPQLFFTRLGAFLEHCQARALRPRAGGASPREALVGADGAPRQHRWDMRPVRADEGQRAGPEGSHGAPPAMRPAYEPLHPLAAEGAHDGEGCCAGESARSSAGSARRPPADHLPPAAAEPAQVDAAADAARPEPGAAHHAGSLAGRYRGVAAGGDGRHAAAAQGSPLGRGPTGAARAAAAAAACLAPSSADDVSESSLLLLLPRPRASVGGARLSD